VVPIYLSSRSASPRIVDLSESYRPGPARNAYFSRISPSNEKSNWSVPFGQQIAVDLSIQCKSVFSPAELFVAVSSARGFEVVSWSNRCNEQDVSLQAGTNNFRIEFKDLRLLPGRYTLSLAVRGDRGFEDYVPDAVSFEVTPSPEAAMINAEVFGGVLIASAQISVLE
jgi:hypothetical protein